MRCRRARPDSRRAWAGVMPIRALALGMALPLVPGEGPHQPVEGGDHQAAEDGRHAAVDRQAVEQAGGEVEHEAVDHQVEEAQGEEDQRAARGS